MKKIILWLVMHIRSKLFIYATISFFVFLFFYPKQYSKNTDQEKYVITTFSILEDLTQQLINGCGNHIKVESIISRNKDPHTFNPSPKLLARIKQSEFIVANGLNLEPWLKEEFFKNKIVFASKGIVPLRKAYPPFDYDPHAWHDIGNALIYIKNIKDALQLSFPQQRDKIESNYQDYKHRLEKLDHDIRSKFKGIKNPKVITTHDAFWYFGRAYGIEFLSPQGVSTEEEISPAKIISIIKQIKSQDIKALFFENLSNKATIEQISQETHVKIGGVLYADSLSYSKYSCSTYLDMMKHNSDQLFTALTSFESGEPNIA